MIWDTLESINRYGFLPSKLVRALEYLAETDFSNLPDGRYELDGEQLFYLLQSYELTKHTGFPEVHHDYVDIQYMLQGEERFGIGPVAAMKEVQAHPDRDIWFYDGETQPLLLKERQFVIFWPGEAHAPCLIANDEPVSVRKCVIKVKLLPNEM